MSWVAVWNVPQVVPCPGVLCYCLIERALQEEQQKRIAACPCREPWCPNIAMWRFPDGQVCYGHALERAGLRAPILPGFEAAVKQYGLIDALIAPWLRYDARDDLSRGAVEGFLVRSKEGNTRHLEIVAQNAALFQALGLYERALLLAWGSTRTNHSGPAKSSSHSAEPSWRPLSCAHPSDEGGQLAKFGDAQRRAAGREEHEWIVGLGARPAAGQRSQLPAVVIEKNAIRMPPPVGVDHLKLLPEERMERVCDPHPFPRSGGARCS
jgi:hypothetical protein